MPRRKFETPVTVTLTSKDGFSVTCSALMERDASHLTWNRITLLGGEEQMHEAMQLFSDEISWLRI